MHNDCEEWRSMMTPANENPKLKGHPFYDTLYRNIPFSISNDCTRDPYQFIPKHLLDQDRGRNRTYQYSYHMVSCREHYIRYYQTITGLDQVIGNMMKSLRDRGLAENTVIIYSSDHGLLMGEYGMGGKALLYDYSSKIPCFIYAPYLPEEKKGKTLKNLVSSLDITSTILDYAGIQSPKHMEGKSLRPLVEGENQPWREELFLENLYTGRDDPIYEGIRKGKWKYIRMFDHEGRYLEEDVDFREREPDFEQLFNLELDPSEHFNLVDPYEGSPLLEELREICRNYSDDLNRQREEYKRNFRIEKKQ
jgi:arylsulfatase A-like enzyme